ncbi:MAG: deaminase [Pseudomonadota bacterium]
MERIPDDKLLRPELIMCLCGAVGTNLTEAGDAIETALLEVGYTPKRLRITDLIKEHDAFSALKPDMPEDERLYALISAGNHLRKSMDDNDAAVRLIISQIFATRRELNKDPEVPAEGTCFLVHSIKRPEEVETLRALYGDRVFLISVFERKIKRVENLVNKMTRTAISVQEAKYKKIAEEIIRVDREEEGDPYGQRVEKVYPQADVFLRSGDGMRDEARRFIRLLFGAPFITPSLMESLMFQAEAVSRRSADLSRQIGAVIANDAGQVLATGYNEVPHPQGGVNWKQPDKADYDDRDYKVGRDSAAFTKLELVAEALAALRDAGWLAKEYASLDNDDLAKKALFEGGKPLDKKGVTNILEFGRIVHAEMAALTEASMREISVKGSILYTTTFPCHMCARHIIAAGISRVVFIEPYPKSRAKSLYERMIRIDGDNEGDLVENAVVFESFRGVAPRRFLHMFEMGKRKNEAGFAFDENQLLRAPKSVTSGVLEPYTEEGILAALGDVKEFVNPGVTSVGGNDDGHDNRDA